MKHTTVVLVVTMLLAFVSTANAKKPLDDDGVPFGNGFPSGEHYNLNIIAKKDNFTCPEPEYDPCNVQIFGNVIFIPRVQGDDPITILMESGKKGPKNPKGPKAETDLQVIDWCTETFSDDDEGAVLHLPAHDAGYGVYARITGKPDKGGGGDPNVSITGELFYVEDEAGNDLIFLGLIDKQDIIKFNSKGEVIFRSSTDTSAKGKGVIKATKLTPLFEWTGDVCYVQADANLYCLDGTEYICSTHGLCCIDDGSDGIYERCDLLTDVGVIVDSNLVCPVVDSNGVPYLPVTAECRSYEDEWIFNIADFVGYLWHIDTSGTYVIQVRFYKL